MMNKNLCLNNSEKEWISKVRSVLSTKQKKMIIPTDEIWYVSKDGKAINNIDTSAFGDASVISNTYENGKGIIKFDK